ncbi:hypothetical protein [Clostridium pasteurianum]|uniref:Phage minor structural protein n=1 Tax=Clostridium pasteurianum BC1 TaxID=86416 RepID=R4K535_CLOPA|nr:hypothetical protein [Clostridium pasteurianum]AGK95639.1 hypothetical protein Clopa_0591 [Clostridium pasteurianum BC1]
MYNVSQNFLNVIKQNGRTFKATVNVRGTIFDNNNITEIDLEENVNPTESFMIGGVGSSKLEVTLLNVPSSLILENAPVTATISLLVNGSYDDVPLGVFTVDEVDINKNSTKLTCYDNMILLEQAYFSDLSYPNSINAVAQDICSKAGVQLATVLPNTQINKIDGYTYREAVSFIASFLGGFARFNRVGQLEITTYNDSGVSLDKNNYFPNFTTSQNLFTIGKLTCKAGSTTDSNGNSIDNILTAGTNGNEVQFENPLMTQDQLNSIYNVLKNLSYMPYSMDWQGNQALQAGDKITITDLQGNVYNTLLMDNKITYKGAITATASAVGKTQTGQNFSSSGGISNTVNRIVTEQANIKVLLANTATIEDLTATNAKIDNLVVGTAQISDLAVTTAKIAYEAVGTSQIANLAVGTAQIQTGAITNALISTAAVGTIQIADGSITDAKIVDLTANKITAGTLSVERLEIRGTNTSIVYALNNITGALQSQNVDTLNGEIVTPRTITTDKIVANAITANEIASHTITANEMVANTITASSGIIASIDAGKITTGTLDASLINVINLNASSITSGAINSITITSTSGNSKLTINGASLIGTINGVKGLDIGDHSIGFQDYSNTGAVAAGMFLSYGSDATNANTTGLCIGTAKGFLGFGKEAADGSNITTDFLINYGYNPNGVQEKFIYYGNINMQQWGIYNVQYLSGGGGNIGIGVGWSNGFKNILKIAGGTGKFVLAGDQSSDQWSDFYGNINFNGWTIRGIKEIQDNASMSGGTITINPGNSGGGASFDSGGINFYRPTYFNGWDVGLIANLSCSSLYVSGAKNRIVTTDHYGTRALNAYEMTECYFGDMKRNNIVNGICVVNLDPMFLETVNSNEQYEVFVSPYGNGNVWVDPGEMYPNYFIVRGSADIPFVWEIKVKQRDFENTRMESVEVDTSTVVKQAS